MNKRSTLLFISLFICVAGMAVVWMKGPVMIQATEPHPHHATLVNADGSWKYTNSLVTQTSPYLLQHAHNPVNWHPWGSEAFTKARLENKPIFLSIGYSTCYWCHVMERQVFESPAIAQQMNEHFVNVKVDREERPDVDDIYMTATQLMTRHGGWPMSVFVTPPGTNGPDDPGLKPFFAGTYFPPETTGQLPGFPQVLESLHQAWTESRDEVTEQADRLTDAVRQTLTSRQTIGPVGIDSVQQTTDQLLASYDQTHGGFGGGVGHPKFPQPTYLQFLLAIYENNPTDSVWGAIAHTLDRMARGGMFDQIGGGFHRYSTDEKWLVPHFEKMLYDNGQLLSLYVQAIEKQTNENEHRLYDRILRETSDYVLREMLDETGAFWSAQDAEVNAREGENYIWTADQIHATIKDPILAEFATTLYGLDHGKNFQDPHHPLDEPVNVLYLPQPLHELGDDAHSRRQQVNKALKAVRDQREQPGIDDKVLVAWNGLLIAGLADAGRVLGETRYIEAAARAADAITQHMSAGGDGGLYRMMRDRQVRIPAFLEDYAFFCRGLLALERVGDIGGGRYLEQAQRHMAYAIQQFGAIGGGYYDTLEDQADLLVRKRGHYDGAVPSGNSVMAHNLIELYLLTGNRKYLHRAVDDLRSFAPLLASQSTGMVHMQHALLKMLDVADPEANAQLATAVPAEASSLPDSGPVKVTVDTEGDNFLLTLEIPDELHLNSHTPSMDYLIGTQVSVIDGHDDTIAVTYPPGQMHRYPFAEQPLSVYEGTVQIRISPTDTGDGPLQVVLRYQACTEAQCLAPQDVPLVLRP